MTIADFKKLASWFRVHQRCFPWRPPSSPYAAWVAEIMLQQTQATVVIPYYKQWMQKFPTISSLARAHPDDVIKAWEGLGYYSRARRLHAGAQFLVEHHQGNLPNDYDGLMKIKGLGDYTVCAILAFAFHKKIAAVDGNVLRVLARYLMIEEDITKTTVRRQIRTYANAHLPDHEPWIVTEALIEWGACICQPHPQCLRCPLQHNCQSYLHGVSDSLPIKRQSKKIVHLHRAVSILHYKHRFLIKRGQQGQVMADLYEFPFFDIDGKSMTEAEHQQTILHHYHLRTTPLMFLKEQFHSYTHYCVRLFPRLFDCHEMKDIEDHEWLSLQELQQKAFSAGHRRILNALKTVEIHHAYSSH